MHKAYQRCPLWPVVHSSVHLNTDVNTLGLGQNDNPELTPVHACVVRGRGEPMELPASPESPPGGLVLVPLSVSVPQLIFAKRNFRNGYFGKYFGWSCEVINRITKFCKRS